MKHSSKGAVKRQTPIWALILLLICSGIVTTGVYFGDLADERSWTESTPGKLLPGGREVDSRSGRGATTYLCDGTVRFVVDGAQYEETDLVPGRCIDEGTRSVTVRYDPDDPRSFSTSSFDWGTYLFVGLGAAGFIAALVALLRRLLRRSV